MYQCRFCRKTKPLSEGIVTTWGGNVLFALCPECHPDRPIIMEVREDSQGCKGVFVGFLRAEDIPPDILPVSSLTQVDRFVSQAALSKYERSGEFDEDE